jgi:hypothetical protein
MAVMVMSNQSYANSAAKSQASLASFSFSDTIKRRLTTGGNGMANEKRYVAQKRQRRRRKVAKGRVKLYEQGKIKHDQLSSLAKRFLSRKMRALKKSE